MKTLYLGGYEIIMRGKHTLPLFGENEKILKLGIDIWATQVYIVLVGYESEV